VTLAELAGRQLVFGLTGPTLTDVDVRLFRDTGAGGVILYRRNFDSPARLIRLLQELEEALDRRLLVTIDHEGGRVVMLGDAVTIFPDGLAIGAQSTPREVELQGRIEGRELRRLGIDLAFAPVVDVLGDGYSPNIGIRAYGRDPDRVAALGVARVRGLQASGVSACVKHFPGQGPGPVDAHLALPVIGADWSEMRARHLVPFRAAAEAGVHAIMTSHPFYPALDIEAPATFSRRLVAELIRGELGYQGVIVSDDLEMGALEALAPVGEAAVRAAAAGHDLLLVCHSERAQRAAHAALHDAYRSGGRPRAELETSLERIDRLQAERSERCAGGPPRAEPDGAALASTMARQGARIVAGSRWGSTRRGADGLLAVFPRLSELADRITVEAAMRDEASWLRAALGRHGVTSEDSSSRILLVGVEPTPAEIERTVAAVQGHPATVLFLYDAHLYPSNRALLDAVQATARQLAVVLMRDPWDADWLRPGVTGVTGYGWRASQLEAALEHLLS
jgi:beta-N-acetylhexosaminidase